MPEFESTDGVPAVKGVNRDGGIGVHGVATTNHGVHGDSTSGRGVVGISATFHGVFGHSTENVGVFGESDTGAAGTFGLCHNLTGAGVAGNNDKGGDGVVGRGRRGVVGISDTFQGVLGQSGDNAGVVGESRNFHAIFGVSHSVQNAAVFATNDAGGLGVIGLSESGDSGIGVFGKGSKLAARFEGDVEVTGNINGHPTSKITCFDVSLIGGDCAEEFDVGEAESIEPGTVMVLGEEGGALHQSRQAYDKRVAGVISGAGGYKPGVVLDKRDTRANRVPLALLGKVYCKVDANYEPIEVGDLLTTSDRPGHAMKATEPLKAFGSTIGKALQPLKEGQGLVPILIALQ
jgi:hypothetical protein